MSTSRPSEHRDEILDQFTRQAVPFSTAPGIKDEAVLRLVVDFSGAGPDDTVLDVACGGGLVVCAFAPVVRHATGIDITPAMLERARALAAERGHRNVSWKQGDVLPLPYPHGAFSIVTSRFAFHHFLDPGAVLREMKRVCAPGGRVVVVDSAPAPDKADGELALWLDGKPVMHIAPGARRSRWTGMGFSLLEEGGEPFEGFRWRTNDQLKINFFWLLHYVTENAARQNHVAKPNPINRVWFDDIVVSTEYVGPIQK